MKRSIGPVWIGGGAAFGLVLAALCFATLRLIATPADYSARLAAVERKTSRAESLAAMPGGGGGGGGVYGKGAVCEGLGDAFMEKARESLEASANAEGLGPLQTVWGAPIEAGARIAPLPLSLQVEGPYDRVAAFVDRLGRGTPLVFVDTADLAASDGGVRLSLSGKVFCWTRG